ncbi:MAG: ATP-dependent sacrificial sulfur transferase LarE [Clostridiales bacterium]|nr:ATP-dependent sacrificial sulfur transferase LarE [Clostridiales bacterium]
MKLIDFFIEHPRVAVAFSGGADSAYLLYAAEQYAKEVQAYYIKSAFQPRFELDDALLIAKELGVPIKTINLDIVADQKIASNPSNRCYYCKKKIFETIKKQAEIDGFPVLLDGTNVSDDADDRPGIKALYELSVLSPLWLCGFTKAEIRRLSQEAGLFTWNKPAYACLATRIPTGEQITEEKLRATEAAENYLFSLGLNNFRVRRIGNAAKIQVPAAQIEKIIKNRESIIAEVKQYYSDVLLDLEVRE